MRQANQHVCRLLQLASLLLALLPATTWGLASDRNQPIHIEADKATLNDNKGISIYEGNVVLRQGTLRLKGNRMTVYLRNNQVNKILLAGSPASFSQRADDSNNEQHAEARKIEYLAVEQRIILLEDARIWQDDNEEFRSGRIALDLKENTLNAGGDDPKDRVHITLQPQSRMPEKQEPVQ
jgi:lipopolysaccharide export system protein LptA